MLHNNFSPVGVPPAELALGIPCLIPSLESEGGPI